MNEYCSFCRCMITPTSGRETHHAIPKFIYEYFKCHGNPDLYRIILCSACHSRFTTAWNDIRFEMRRRI